jgi:hypothetical protein
LGKVTLVFSGLLVVLGVAAYLLTGMRSWTALIPSIAGALIGVCGLIAEASPVARKHAMHGAIGLATLGFLASAPGIVKVAQIVIHGEKSLTADARSAAGLKDDQIMLNNDAKVRPVAAKVQAAMATLLLPYIGLGVKSFIDARRRRAAGQG